MNNGNGPDILRVSPSVRLAETPDGAVLLDVTQGICFSINCVGVLIWKQAGEGRELDQIAEYIAETFNISLEQARIDTQEFLDVLKEKQLVQALGSSGSQNGRHRRFWRIPAGLSRLVRGKHAKRVE